MILRLYLFLPLILLILLPGCYFELPSLPSSNNEPDPEPPPPENPCTTPGRALKALGDAFTESMSYGDYINLLLFGGDYEFRFDPMQAGQMLPDGYIIPQSWTYMDDSAAAWRMFDEVSYTHLMLSVHNWQDYDFQPEGDTFTAKDADVEMHLWSEDMLHNHYAYGPCDFEFVKVDGSWKISRWVDKTWDWYGTTEGCSVGYMRALYHQILP
jgi:hypothetical protein